MKIFNKKNCCVDGTFFCEISIFGVTIFKKSRYIRNQMMYPQRFKCNTLIRDTDKILIVAPHPDDEVIGCGGIISKYTSKNIIDVLCINSSGVKYDWDENSAEEIADERISEFKKVMDIAGVNKYYIAKIFGIPPMFDGIKSHLSDYKRNFNFSDYDKIFIPSVYDGHREHQFVSNYIVPLLLKDVSTKPNLQICMYEIWSAQGVTNYFEDISDFIENKEKLISVYASRKGNRYFECISSLNNYRGLSINVKYAEAYNVKKYSDFLEMIDKSQRWNK